MGMIDQAMNGGGMPAPGATAAPAQQSAPQEDPRLGTGAVDDGSDEPDPNIEAETDPGYQTAIKFARTVLYEKGAARDLAIALKKSPDTVEALANHCYNVISMVDEKTEGAIPDELLLEFGMEILTEVVEIGRAAGIQIAGQTIAETWKSMMLRYAGENGLDASQLSEAMGAVGSDKVGAVLDTAEAEAAQGAV